MTSMQYLNLGPTNLRISRIVYGCMRIGGDGSADARRTAEQAVHAAVEAGITTFDHADIYGDGSAESVFGEILAASPGLRDKLVVMTKCGIVVASDRSPKHYNLSGEYIVRSVEASLARLRIDHVEVLMLHRPDYLVEADEVAAAFARLKSDGKVEHFGVSNFLPHQLVELRSAMDMPLVTNQVEINLHNVSALHNGTLEQCRRLGIAPLAWSPLAGAAYPAMNNTLSEARLEAIAEEVREQGERYSATPAQVALAWVMKIPGGITPVVGSIRPERVAESVAALSIDYSREDWYRLLEARNGQRVA